MSLSPAYQTLIEAMVDKMVDQYLTGEAAPDKDSSEARPNPVPLPRLPEAA